jgi:cytochrome b561
VSVGRGYGPDPPAGKSDGDGTAAAARSTLRPASETIMPRGFSLPQILLHWIVAVLVLLQYLNDDAIGAAWRTLRRGAEEVPGGFLVTAHVVVGSAILVFVVWRIGLRLARGVPPPPDDEPLLLRAAAAATHLLLYALLLLLPLSGLAAWFGGFGGAIDLHRLMTTLLLSLVAVHLGGALYQRFVLRSHVLGRIVRPGLAQER